MMTRLELLIPPLLLTGVLMALILLLSWWLPSAAFALPAQLSLGLSTLFGVLAIAWVLPAALAFAKANTTVNPQHPENSQTLVTSGWYRVSRNPMYVGFLFALISITCFTGHVSGVLISLLFVAYMNHFQIRPEERILTAHFGTAYVQYCQKVRRWL